MPTETRATHSQCAYYKDGFCTLYGAPMPPDAPACPNFTPAATKPVPERTAVKEFPPTTMPISWRIPRRLRMRRRYRRGRRSWP